MEEQKKLEPLPEIDDFFFRMMVEDKEICEEILAAILKQKVTVCMAAPQSSFQDQLGSSMVMMDAMCRMEDKSYANVRIQAMPLIVNAIEPSPYFGAVSKTIVIFVSNYDVFGDGQAVYYKDSIGNETGKPVGNGFKEIYVNSEADDGSDVAALMKVLIQQKLYDLGKFPKLSFKKMLFEEAQGMFDKLNDTLDALKEECRAEVREETRLEVCSNIFLTLIDHGMSTGEAQEICSLSDNEIAGLIL